MNSIQEVFISKNPTAVDIDALRTCQEKGVQLQRHYRGPIKNERKGQAELLRERSSAANDRI